MKKTVLVCDYCKNEKNVHSLNLFYDTCTGGAGSSENEYRIIDLCDFCMAEFIKYHFNKENGDNKSFFAKWKKY